MDWLRVRKWEHWQSYRSDRNQPPWIKLHRRLILDPDFVMLKDSEKAHLMCIWIIAADRKGKIPDDASLIRKMAGLDADPDLDRLQALGFLEKWQDDAKTTPARRQMGGLDTDTDTEKPLRAPSGSRFAEWYAHYPKKKGKAQALKTWKRKKLDQHADTIIADTRKRAEVEWTDPQFIPMASTYINQERWHDEIEVAHTTTTVPKDLDACVRFAAERGIQPRTGESLWEFRSRVESSIRTH